MFLLALAAVSIKAAFPVSDAAGVPALAPLPPTRLRTDGAARPIGVQHQHPRLSWALDARSSDRGLRQTHYQIQLNNATHLLWDSGKVASNRTVLESCCGGGDDVVVFSSDTAYSWRVRSYVSVAARLGAVLSSWSPPALFDTALLNASDWGSARWLGTSDGPPGNGNGQPPPPQANLFRVEFELPPAAAVSRARVYVSGVGYYRMHVNGQRADDHELGALTVYERTLLYDAVDVAPLLHPGATNALAISLGRGWYSCSGCLALRLGEACGRAGLANATHPYGDSTCGQYEDWPLGPTGIITCSSPCPRAFILRLVVTLAGAQPFELVSSPDGKWAQSAGPVLSESIYLGVVHDGRLEQPGWLHPGFEPGSHGRWVAATAPPVTPAGAPQTLTAQRMPSIRKIRTLLPKRIWSPRPGVFVVDFGENMAGWAALTIPGAAARRGAPVTMVYGEILTNASSCWSCQVPYRSNISRLQSCPCRNQVAMRYPTSPMVDVYIVRGANGAATEDETFEPVGSYHGFRYVEVYGYPAVLGEHNVVAHVVHTDVRPVGVFGTSSPLVNKLQAACVRTVAVNQMGMPTDCPQRERRGWAGDAQISSDTVAWNFDAQSYWSQYLDTIADNQAKYASSNPRGSGKGMLGGISGVIPDYAYDGGGNSDPVWQAVYPRLWHHMLLFYDDRATLARHYHGVKAYIDYLLQGRQNHALLPPKPRLNHGS